jgi:hypothetical protein
MGFPPKNPIDEAFGENKVTLINRQSIVRDREEVGWFVVFHSPKVSEV